MDKKGKTKHRTEPAIPIISNTQGLNGKFFHVEPPVPSDVYPVIDTDLARDNLENDIPAADLNELR